MPARPFQKDGLTRRVGPFVLVATAATAATMLQVGAHPETVIAAVGVATLIVAIFAIPWERLPRWTDAVVPFAYLGIVVVMRDAEGGRLAAAGLLVFLPIVWFALFGVRAEVIASVVAALGIFLLPPVLIGGDRYPAPEYGKVFVFGLVLTLVAGTVFRLVQERRVLTEQLAELANRDPLTRVANRRAWDDGLARAVEAASLAGTPLTVGILDLDNLKQINDVDGHEAGDAALRFVSTAWADALPPGAMIARLGGDEFGVLLPGLAPDDVEDLVGRLGRSSRPYGCSVGIASYTGTEDGHALMRAADDELYRAKENRAGWAVRYSGIQTAASGSAGSR
jgi:diguanylate cyclase (GGDEF)-like protein